MSPIWKREPCPEATAIVVSLADSIPANVELGAAVIAPDRSARCHVCIGVEKYSYPSEIPAV